MDGGDGGGQEMVSGWRGLGSGEHATMHAPACMDGSGLSDWSGCHACPKGVQLHTQEVVLHVVADGFLWRSFRMGSRQLDLVCLAAYLRSTATAAAAVLNRNTAVSKALAAVQEASLQLVTLGSNGLQQVSYPSTSHPAKSILIGLSADR